MIIETASQLPSDGYDNIVIDWPWEFKVYSRDTGLGRSAESHYPTLSLEEGRKLPIYDLAAKDAWLWHWLTSPTADEGIALAKYWGFTFVNLGFTWVKTTKTGKFFFGMGYTLRGNAEQCALFKKGNPKKASSSVSQLVVAPFTRHSQKPDEVQRRIEWLNEGDEWYRRSMIPHEDPPLTRRYLEIFARRWMPGWDSIGNELGNRLDIRDILGSLHHGS